MRGGEDDGFGVVMLPCREALFRRRPSRINDVPQCLRGNKPCEEMGTVMRRPHVVRECGYGAGGASFLAG